MVCKKKLFKKPSGRLDTKREENYNHPFFILECNEKVVKDDCGEI